MIDREEALRLLIENVKNENLVKHTLAVEAIMRGLARHFSEDSDLWGLSGLLHDIDYSLTESTPDKHAVLAEEILNGLVSPEVLKAIQAHNSEHTGIIPESRLEKALIAADSVSGLLIACALVQPTKRIADVRVDSVKKKFRQKDFARAVSRERILAFKDIGLEEEDFYSIALENLKKISNELGL